MEMFFNRQEEETNDWQLTAEVVSPLASDEYRYHRNLAKFWTAIIYLRLTIGEGCALNFKKSFNAEPIILDTKLFVKELIELISCFRCEVTAETPTFTTLARTLELTVIGEGE